MGVRVRVRVRVRENNNNILKYNLFSFFLVLTNRLGLGRN